LRLEAASDIRAHSDERFERLRYGVIRQPYPPSGIAAGYVWFDVMALLVAPYVIALARRSRPLTDEFSASAESH
jgi:hypothetical protein